MFDKIFSKLKAKDRKTVLDQQQHEHRWRNDHVYMRVFATTCERTVTDRDPDRSLPCASCIAVLNTKAFKNALAKEPADDKNYSHINHRYRNPLLGAIYARTLGLKNLIEKSDAPCVQLAQGILDGKYDNQIFEGLIEVMVTKHDREQRGVGMQNFRYSPAWDELCNIIRIHSPTAYEALRRALPTRSIRSFRQKEARAPRFPLGISDRTFKMAAEHLDSIGYTGPVNLSCDDTKLNPSMRLYWDKDQQSHVLVGGDNGPYRVADPDQIQQLFDEGQVKKATKIRLWSLTLEAPKTTPIILCAMPISNDLDANVLLGYLVQCMDGLLDHSIQVISYACDGTETERSVQKMFIQKAEVVDYVIKSPRNGFSDTKVAVIKYRGQVMCMIQDSKHALKTYRNNLFSGARLLVLGNFVAIYEHIRILAHEIGTPLYKRDVEKLDRQDDNAASRLFSADTLKFLADQHPDYLGEIVYLFVFGELIDAYQNRSISHPERLKLALRARYFLDSWEAFLATSQYLPSKYFLSREAVDITRIIIEGYISLLYIHRDFISGLWPFIPWLHSTEACEHTFGQARRVVKDFTALDFIYMIPKLHITMQEAVFRARTSDPKARASGYNHTYFDMTGLNLPALTSFPTNNEIDAIANIAAEEVESLFVLLGVYPQDLRSAKNSNVTLPAIGSWYTQTKLLDPSEIFSGAQEDGIESLSDSDDESISDACILQDLMDQVELSSLKTRHQEQEVLNLTYAAMAITAGEIMDVQQFSEMSKDDLKDFIQQEYQHIQAVVNSLPDERMKPFGQTTMSFDSLDMEPLILQRRTHQTRQAADGVRAKSALSQADSSDGKVTMRKQLIHNMNRVLKEAQDYKGIASGVERMTRWKENEQNGASGNSANAAVVASTAAKKAAEKRQRIFATAKVPRLLDIVNARITSDRSLKIGDIGVVFTPDGLRIGHVIVLYSKTGGKNAKHASVLEVTNVCAASHIGIQVFDYMHGRQFRAITGATARLQTRQFAIIPPIAFLTLLLRPVRRIGVGASENLELDAIDMDMFKVFRAAEGTFKEAMRLFRKRSAMNLRAVVLSLACYGSFLATTAVPVVSGISVYRLRTSTAVQTSDLYFAHGVSLNIQQSGRPNGNEESQLSPRSQLPPSDFLLLAQYVGIVLEAHHSAGGFGIWHAFGGDIKAACESKSETGPFKTISLFVYESDLLTTNELLRKGVSKNGWSLKLKVTEGINIVEYKDESKTISAPIEVYAATGYGKVQITAEQLQITTLQWLCYCRALHSHCRDM
ncbi:hypothetical protein H0H93_002909 [Arthromyces matolae]|nr:hypothetical protein H0H93_002909 [Arthromyces matolae]